MLTTSATSRVVSLQADEVETSPSLVVPLPASLCDNELLGLLLSPEKEESDLLPWGGEMGRGWALGLASSLLGVKWQKGCHPHYLLNLTFRGAFLPRVGLSYLASARARPKLQAGKKPWPGGTAREQEIHGLIFSVMDYTRPVPGKQTLGFALGRPCRMRDCTGGRVRAGHRDKRTAVTAEAHPSPGALSWKFPQELPGPEMRERGPLSSPATQALPRAGCWPSSRRFSLQGAVPGEKLEWRVTSSLSKLQLGPRSPGQGTQRP